MFKVKRETRTISIINSWNMDTWMERATFVYLTLFGVRIRKIHAYFISYRGEFCDLKDGWKYDIWA